MTVNFTIRSRTPVTYSKAGLSAEGAGRYHIRRSSYDEVITGEDHGAGHCPGGNDPVIANRLVLFGDVYYTGLSFEKEVLSGVVDTAPERFSIYTGFSFSEEGQSVHLMQTGRRYENGTYTEFSEIRGGFVPGLISDWDSGPWFTFTAPSGAAVRSEFLTRAGLCSRYSSRAEDMPEFYSIISDTSQNGIYRYGAAVLGSGCFRIAYKDAGGTMKLLDTSSQGGASFTMPQLLMPLTDALEYTAGRCALDKWTDSDVSAIENFINTH